MNNKKMEKNKNPKASILISTIMILSVVMVTVLSTMYISAVSRNASTNSNESLVAYQRADNGIENTLSVIVNGYGYDGEALDSGKKDVKFSASSWTDTDTKCITTGSTRGIIEKKIGTTEEVIYRVQLYRRLNTTTDEMVPVFCENESPATAFSEITRIKSVGVLPGKAQRAISADVPLPEAYAVAP